MFTAEEVANLIMEEEEEWNLIDSDDSIESTTSDEESSVYSESDEEKEVEEMEEESEPTVIDAADLDTDVDMEISTIPQYNSSFIDDESALVTSETSIFDSTVAAGEISTFSGDSAIPNSVFDTLTHTYTQPSTAHISAFFGLKRNCKNISNSEKKNSSTSAAADDWKMEELTTIPEFNFDENVGLTIEMPTDALPIDYARLLLTDELISEICICTNLYANCVIDASGPMRRRSIFKCWKPVKEDELRKFLGLVFHMGLINMPTYKHYWKKDHLFKNDIFSSVMSRGRFQLIMRFLHFGNKPDFVDDRLGKVKMLIHHLNDTMSELFIPDKDLSIDESMMLFRGRLIFRQYIKNKRHKYGVKYYELCTSDGLIMRISIYSGQAENSTLGKTAAVVINLMQDYLCKGHHIFLDNYYNSVPLTQYLSNNQTYVTGTLRKDRVGIPTNVLRKKLKKGEMTWGCNKEVTVAKWKDKREVLMISNAHNPKMVEVKNKHGRLKMKPDVVRDYNQGMSGVDRSDQMLSYNTALKRSLRWNKKVGIHILEMLLHNAHYLYKLQSKNKLQITEFKQQIIQWLIGDLQLPRSHQPVAHFHYLFPIPATEKKKTPTRRCIHCSIKNNRKESRYICAYCIDQPALCIHPCFVEYHIGLGVAHFPNTAH